MIDPLAAWHTFLTASKKSMDDERDFSSPHRGHLYNVIEVDQEGVQVMTEQATTSRKPKIRFDLFNNSITRVNEAGGNLAKTKMCPGNVLFETVIVELLPALSWDQQKQHIIETIIPSINTIQEITGENVKVTANRDVTIRRGQGKLRSELIKQYNGTCCVTGSTVQEILYAAHIVPYAISFDNSDTNALLMKSDIHDLYDAYLLGIDPVSLKIVITDKIRKEYGHLEGVNILRRSDQKAPNPEGMLKRWEKFKSTN